MQVSQTLGIVKGKQLSVPVTYFFSNSESVAAIRLNPGALEEVAKGNISVLSSTMQEDAGIVQIKQEEEEKINEEDAGIVQIKQEEEEKIKEEEVKKMKEEDLEYTVKKEQISDQCK